MHEQGKFPERSTVIPADDRLCAKRQLLPGFRIVECRACLFNDQCPEQPMLLMNICKQMVMKKYGPKLLICKKTFDQGFILSVY